MWFWFALLTAAFSGLSVILNKKALYNVSAALVSWSLFVLPIPVLLVLVIKQGLPQINTMFYIGVIGSSIIFAVSKTISLHSLKNNLLSKLFPLTAFGTFFSYLFALVILSEKISPISFIGLFMILVGAYLLNVDRAKEHILLPLKLLVTHKESFVFIIAMIFTSLTGIFDKIGVINTFPSDALFVLLVEDILMAVLLTMYIFKKEKRWVKDLYTHFWLLVIGSFIYTFVSLFFLIGVSHGPVALVGGIKKLELLFVLAMSQFLFHDKPAKHIWLASAIMLIGVLLIKIG